MIGAFDSIHAFSYKVCLDGLDLTQGGAGKALVNSLLRKQIVKFFTKFGEYREVAEDLISYAVTNRRKKEFPHPLPISLRDKYEVGVFTLAKKNPFSSVPYALLNPEWLDIWHSKEHPVYGIDWMVIPSRGQDGKINDIGFRVLDTGKVLNAVKWVFMFGQRSTFGLNRVKDFSKVVLVEGATDQIAFEQSGVENTVGVGAVRLTNGHKEELRGCKYGVCWDNDSIGVMERKGHKKIYFFNSNKKDPFEAWVEKGSVKLIEVENA